MVHLYAISSSPPSDHYLVHEPSPALEAGSLQRDNQTLMEAQWPPRYITQTRKWIEACNTLHGSACVPDAIPQRPPEDVPLWLIDTREQCIVPGTSAHRYLALSYVWPESRGSSDFGGSLPRTLLLDNASVAEFQRPEFLEGVNAQERIPAVIRHAMEFTCALGERYLWVDRLCIVQDDLGDGGTFSQVGKMDKIYSGAYLTIIAAATDEMYEDGCAVEWPLFETAREGRWDHDSALTAFEVGIRLSEVGPPKMSEEDIVQVMSARYIMLSRSHWATRGWTYQEQILCKRAVVFMDSGCFWDCHCCVWDGVDLFPGQEFEGIALRADMGQRLNTRWWPDFSLYLDLICPYNGREFSYPQDATLGISGVLNALRRSFPGGFIHGLPRLFLDHALLWQPFESAERRMDRNEEGMVRSSLPSWSWCGWQCYVDPWSLCSGLSYITEKACRNRGRSWRTRNLVEWHLSTAGKMSTPIVEPGILDQLVVMNPSKDGALPAGWKHHSEHGYDLQGNAVGTISGFVHASDDRTFFSHPIPVDLTTSERNILSTPAYLSCSTTTASFQAATELV